MARGDMRSSARHDLRFRIVYDDGNTYNVGVVDDVSETGMLLECPELVPVGKLVRLEPVDPEEDELFELDVRVVRHIESDDLARRAPDSEGGHGLVGMGLEFTDHSERTRDAISRMIARLEAKPKSADPYLGAER